MTEPAPTTTTSVPLATLVDAPVARGSARLARTRARLPEVLLGAVCFAIVLVVHRSVPFWTLPQGIAPTGWTGFAKDFAANSLLHPFARQSGYPAQVPLAFGLTGVWPMAVLIRLGVQPVDAYVLVQALVLLIAGVGAVAFARRLATGRYLSIGLATIWLVLPIIWVSAVNYMMTGWGFALLPAYLWVVLGVIQVNRKCGRARVRGAAVIATFVAAAFMDGYSFVMFVVAAGLLLIATLLHGDPPRGAILRRAVPPTVAGVVLGYLAYSMYAADLPEVASRSVDFFRGFGVDLAFIVVPTTGVTLLWDSLGGSIERSESDYWGDASVWSSTFSVVLLGFALWAAWRTLPRRRLAVGMVCVTIVGFYLALGPSLKLDARIPGAHGPSPLLPAALAGPATGSAWLFEHVPGFTAMRASYRWLALGAFGAWGLIVLALGTLRPSRRSGLISAAVVGVLLAAHLPHLGSSWSEGRQVRETVVQIDATRVPALAAALSAGERVAFLPMGNDFQATWYAPTLRISSYNVGGDRHNTAARAAWPPEIAALAPVLRGDGRGVRDPRTAADLIVGALRGGNLDVAVLHYFSLWMAEQCGDPTAAGSPCLDQFAASAPVLDLLEQEPYREVVTVVRRPEFATVRLA